MCEEVLSLLTPVLNRPGALLVDATLGLGGHASLALAAFPGLSLVGIDRDPQAIASARDRLAEFTGRYEIHQATFDRIPEILAGRPASGILFDLGLSSLQIDSGERGFAYAFDAPLSMRMDQDQAGLTAADVVNTYSAEELARLFWTYGDERHARRIADAIVAARQAEPFSTSARLVSVIAAAVPATATRSGHPAKRVFQAIRMEVNDERHLLEQGLPAGLACLGLHGRAAVLSYHSGEDRIVKRLFAQAQADQVPPHLAVVPEPNQAKFRLITRGAVKPGAPEMAANPRSQSARLRVIERIKEDE